MGRTVLLVVVGLLVVGGVAADSAQPQPQCLLCKVVHIGGLVALCALVGKLATALWHNSNPKHDLVDVRSPSARAPPNKALQPHLFKNKQGVFVYTRQWLPAGTPRGLVFVVHGYGEHCGRYNALAGFLNTHGFAVFAFDHQGHGQSEGTRAYVERFSHFVDDVVMYMNAVKAGDHHPYGKSANQMPVFVLGHSMGGLIAIHTAMRLLQDPSAKHLKLAGLVLSGPALVPDPKQVTPTLIAIGRFLSKVLPKMQLTKLDVSKVSRDPEVVRSYVNDPLNYHQGARARTAAELIQAMGVALQGAGAISTPTLLCQASADALCLPEGADRFFASLGAEDRELVMCDGAFHEIFLEPDREVVFGVVARWLLKHTPAAK